MSRHEQASPAEHVDFAVVGGGIIGLASARELARRHPDASVCVLEREGEVAAHQSGHNSGVVHAGVYYPAGSLKAQLCTQGRTMLEEFCTEHAIPLRRAGKLIVATDPAELPRLAALEDRARANGVPGLRRLDAAGIREVEPHVTGLAALHSPETGIVDYAAVCVTVVDELRSAGHEVRLHREVTSVDTSGSRAKITLADGEVLTAGRVLVCAGAWSDRVAVGSGAPAEPRIVPFRGSYLEVRRERRDLVKGMVYPVPDPELPFLGVHLTRHVDESLSIGPTALLVGSRRASRPWSVDARDLWDVVSWPGVAKLAWRFRGSAMTELRHAASRAAVVRAAQRFVPSLTIDDVVPGFSGVRAQAIQRSGELLDDFAFSEGRHVVHVRNAPSPGATSSFAIAKLLADRLDRV